MSHRTKLCALGLALLGFACEVDGRDDDQELTDPEVTEEQEQEVCASLGSSTAKYVQAGAAIGEGHAIAADSGLKEINLTTIAGGMGGYVEIQVDDGTPLFMLVKEDVPVEVVDDADGEVDYLERGDGSEICAEASARYLWIVDDGPHHLRIGPTGSAVVNLSLRVVQ